MAKVKQTEKQKMNPILWILFAIILPLIIILVAVGIISGIAGFNVMDWAKEKGSDVPIVSRFTTSEGEAITAGEAERLTETLQDRDEEIIELNKTISDLETNIDELEDEILKHEHEIDSMENTGDMEVESSEETSNSVKEIAKTYEEMKSANSAAILQLMEKEEVLLILQELPTDIRGDILQAMDAEIAADLTVSLMAD